MGAASGLFFHAEKEKETLNKRVRPGDGQMEFLRVHKDRLEEHLRSDLRARCGCSVSTWLQGSYKLHTLIRPVHKHDDYDVDIGAYFEWGRAQGELLTPIQIRGALQDSLVAFKNAGNAVKRVEEPPKERCSRVYYERLFHIDVPAYHHHVDTGVARLATVSNGWEYSDPEKMVRWFQERLEGDERAQVRRITRYLKAWAALNFSNNKASLPSSLMLTVLAVDAYIEAIGQRQVQDDDAVADLVRAILHRLQRDRRVGNPVDTDQDRDLNRLNDEGFTGFMESLRELHDIAERAIGCQDEADAAAIWTEAFDYLFPLPDVTGFAEEFDPHRGLLVPTPEIRIDISDTVGGTSKRHYFGQVELARLKEWLRFRIINRDVLPIGSTVRWVVRNIGDNAYQENDLGHSNTDDGTLVHDESAAYIGRHFMDCEVRVGGQLRSITRVPVMITSAQIPTRHPQRPAYTKIRRRR